MERLERSLGETLHCWKRRELENYLLVPEAILKAMRVKHRADPDITGRLDGATEQNIDDLLKTTAKSLYGVVLIKRIRSELSGIGSSAIPRESVPDLTLEAHSGELPDLIRRGATDGLQQALDEVKLDDLVFAQRATLDSEWTDGADFSRLAPGAELLDAVFRQFGSKYRKSKDAALKRFQIGLVLPGAVVVLLRIPMQEDRCVPIRWICESGRSSTAMPG